MRRRVLIILSALLIMIVSTATSFAAGEAIVAASSAGKSFSASWDDRASKTSGGFHYVDYGYRKATNRDYAYADSNGYRHQSKIVNKNGTYYGPKKWANEGRSDKTAAHKGSVKYYCWKVPVN